MSMIIAQTPKTYFGSEIQKSLGSLPGLQRANLPGHNYTRPVGDRVRIFKYKSKFEKGYVGFWTNEIFIVDNVNTTLPPTYELIDQDKEQITVNKEHLKERIGDVKRYFKRQINNKDFIDDTKLQQEVTSLKRFIEEQLLNVVD
ncbi:hypothetical protein LOTGIDRAFT_157540 [Lottia gigantea]|uniref:Uncharacterized protein n=1 Tax=Lottia gigantea TaxID=225164 RepID=V4ABM4_LOTGI|nr:hypothetical protein LOTGIDRAFT_157540 [Lottia gigantea]ESP01364.1 hypothetical protein LOTGIDRAFT_157540 [Lottia gigantea]